MLIGEVQDMDMQMTWKGERPLRNLILDIAANHRL